MRPVEIAGWGLSTHLGRGREQHVAGLRDNRPRHAEIELSGFTQPLHVPLLLAEGGDWSQPARRLEGMLCHAVEDALAMAGLAGNERSELALYLGSSSFAIGVAERLYRQQVREPGNAAVPLPEAGFGEFLHQVRQWLQLAGSDRVFNTACAASANALLSAARAIATGRVDSALVIGVELANYTTVAGFAGMQLLTQERLRPFDRRRNGLVLGEGCGALVLRAATPGARLVCSGGASRCDTFGISASNPDGSGIGEVMAAALADAGVAPQALVAVKGHGTASPLNDDGEARGLDSVFGPERPPLFLLKGLLGHTLGACGAIEAALLATALEAGLMPGSAGCDDPDPALGPAPQGMPDRARPGTYLLNYFGFGGNNCALVFDWQGAADA